MKENKIEQQANADKKTETTQTEFPKLSILVDHTGENAKAPRRFEERGFKLYRLSAKQISKKRNCEEEIQVRLGRRTIRDKIEIHFC